MPFSWSKIPWEEQAEPLGAPLAEGEALKTIIARAAVAQLDYASIEDPIVAQTRPPSTAIV